MFSSCLRYIIRTKTGWNTLAHFASLHKLIHLFIHIFLVPLLQLGNNVLSEASKLQIFFSISGQI